LIKNDEQYEDPAVLKVNKIIRDLENINRDIRKMLDRLPLKHYKEIAHLNNLINRQQQLINFSLKKPLPPRVRIFFDNAKDSAVHLRAKYAEAISKGKLRRDNAR
jgi:hypothetical protein